MSSVLYTSSTERHGSAVQVYVEKVYLNITSLATIRSDEGKHTNTVAAKMDG